MLQHDEPTTTCWPPERATPSASFVQFAFEHAGLDWEKHVRYDERYERPTEVDALIGDASKAEDRWAGRPKYRHQNSPASWSTLTSASRAPTQ